MLAPAIPTPNCFAVCQRSVFVQPSLNEDSGDLCLCVS
jgi:hypothetical protein